VNKGALALLTCTSHSTAPPPFAMRLRQDDALDRAVSDSQLLLRRRFQLDHQAKVDIGEAERIVGGRAGEDHMRHAEIVGLDIAQGRGESCDTRVLHAEEMHVEGDIGFLDLDIMKGPIILDLVTDVLNQFVEIGAAGEKIETVGALGAPEISGLDLAGELEGNIGLFLGRFDMDLPIGVARRRPKEFRQPHQLHLCRMARLLESRAGEGVGGEFRHDGETGGVDVDDAFGDRAAAGQRSARRAFRHWQIDAERADYSFVGNTPGLDFTGPVVVGDAEAELIGRDPQGQHAQIMPDLVLDRDEGVLGAPFVEHGRIAGARGAADQRQNGKTNPVTQAAAKDSAHRHFAPC
jgi:hypothetical protein